MANPLLRQPRSSCTEHGSTLVSGPSTASADVLFLHGNATGCHQAFRLTVCAKGLHRIPSLASPAKFSVFQSSGPLECLQSAAERVQASHHALAGNADWQDDYCRMQSVLLCGQELSWPFAGPSELKSLRALENAALPAHTDAWCFS